LCRLGKGGKGTLNDPYQRYDLLEKAEVQWSLLKKGGKPLVPLEGKEVRQGKMDGSLLPELHAVCWKRRCFFCSGEKKKKKKKVSDGGRGEKKEGKLGLRSSSAGRGRPIYSWSQKRGGLSAKNEALSKGRKGEHNNVGG